jgi:hypothetical protein
MGDARGRRQARRVRACSPRRRSGSGHLAIFQAEELFQKATVLVKTRQYPKASDAEQATKLNAEEPERREGLVALVAATGEAAHRDASRRSRR